MTRTPNARSSMPPMPANLVNHLRALARLRPDDVGLTVVSDEGGATRDMPITYAALDRRIRSLAARLQSTLAAGDRALVMLDNGDDHVVSFFACFYAGVVAVPVFPPESVREKHVARVKAIAADAQARAVLTHSTLLAQAGMADAFPAAWCVAVDTLDAGDADAWRPHEPASTDIAFLQYTSGSTSAPKGVMVSHGNLMANLRAIQDGMSAHANDVFISWLPLNHDMGLIGGLMQPLLCGAPLVLMSPRFFLERPVRWLEAISRHRGTVSGGPDFAYRLCVDRISDAQRERLDLSTWTLAFSGAEPVRVDTLDAFRDRMSPAGFAASALYPCYGLAESTLFVAGGRRGAGMLAQRFSRDGLAAGEARSHEDGAPLASCGRPAPLHAVHIVDPQSGRMLEDGDVGEVWASGPSIAAGYWNKPAESADAFVERDGRRWLRTGDLGFRHGGELFISGRIKDMIIVRGHNLYPQDIERAVEEGFDGARKGRVAAFAVRTPDGEGIGIALEVSRAVQKRIERRALVETLAAVVGEQFGQALSVVVLLNPGGLPKTTSGKLQRSACRAAWQQRTADAYAIFEHGDFVAGDGGGAPAATPLPDEAVVAALAVHWRDLLRLPEDAHIGPQAHFFAQGGNSLAAVQLSARVAQQWNVDLPLDRLFEHPRLGDMAREVSRLCASVPRSSRPPIPALSAAQRGQPLPLSHGQARQWFMWRLDPHSTAYHVGVALRLDGALDATALRHAVADVTARHEALRTRFPAGSDGAPVQCIDAGGGPEWVVVPQAGDPDGDAGARAAAEARRLHDRPFDLQAGPVWRVGLIDAGVQSHVLAIVMHHIIADGASVQRLVDEIAAGYAARASGAVASSRPLRIQCADHAVWQRGWLASGEQARQLAWWADTLAVTSGDGPPVLSLPVDRPRPVRAHYRAARHAVALPAPLIDEVRRAAEWQRTSLFTLLLSALQVLLYRHTGQEDVRIGVPVANRHHAEAEGLIGFFVNTLVLRSVFDGRTRLDTVMLQAKTAVLGAQAHPDLPFDVLVDALQPGRSLSHSPLFQVMFNHLVENTQSLAALPGLRASRLTLASEEAQFELVLESREQADGGLTLEFVYAAELFDATTVERLAAHYVSVLEACARDASVAVGDVALLGNEARAQIASWSARPEVFPAARPVHHLFEQRARQRPDEVALRFGDTALAYAELNVRANRLAHHLIALGVRPEAKIGIAMERSVEMVVALLACMKAGGAYVPFDPRQPKDRLRQVVADSGVQRLLTQAAWLGHLPDVPGVETLALDATTPPDGAATDPDVPLHGENLVYVIYTSGSTGQPKGAANRHSALYNRLAWGQHHQPIGPGDTVLQKTPFNFDISFWEFFWPLANGATLAVAGPGEHRDPVRLSQLIQQHRVTTIHFVPSMLQAFLSWGGMPRFDSLRRIVCSGEALSAELQNRALAAFPGVSLLNLYGPTEAAIETTWWDCRDDGAATVPIGRPIGNVAVRVLDADLALVPPGVAGELFLGGEALARGYWQQPGLTSQRYVADPLADDGSRLYRTGDMVRWHRDGHIEYLGRIDHQVKIRGFRIELGEIEARLLELPEVREAVVVARTEADGDRLVAYVSAADGAGVEPSRVKERLAQVLPDYMVPPVVVVLATLPLNPNGKIDRKALPEPAPAQRPAHEAPRGEVARTLAAIWSEVLSVENVGMNDNFFDLGGQSLRMIRVHRLLEERLQTDVSLVDLFSYPTIGDLARRIEAGAAAADPSQAPSDDDQALRQRAARLRRSRSVERIG